MTKLKHKPTRHAVKLLMTSKLRHGIGHPTFVKCLAKIKSHSTPIVRNRSRVTRKRRSYSGTKRVLLKIKKQVNNSCPANLEKWTALVSTHRDTILRNPLSSREIVAKDSDYELFSSADSNSNFESETENDEEPFYRSLNSSCQDISLNETYIGARNTASKNVVTEDDPNVATFSRALQSPEYRNEPDFQSDEGFHVQSQSSDEIKVQTTSNSEVSSGLSPTSHDSSTFGDPEKTIDNNSSSAKVNESDSKTINARSGIKQTLAEADEDFINSSCCLCPLNEEYFLLIINRPAKIAVVGCIDLRVVWGCLNINGYKLKPEETFTPVYSPRSHSHIVFTAESEPLLKCPNELPSKSSSFIEEQRSKLQRELQKWLERTPALEIVKQCHDEVAVMLCKKLQDSTVHYLNHFVKRMFLPFPLPKPKSSLYLPPEHGFKFCSTLCAKSLDYDSTWQQTVSHIQSYNKIEGSRPLMVVVCGGKRIGKSTFCRYLLNTLLNECDTVSFIDGDPSQCEFTPPGLLSYSEISKPCLGPPFIHLQDPVLSTFMGDVSVENYPGHYVRCFEELWNAYLKESFEKKRPLIVNTMGWIKGIGEALLVDIAHIMQPTHLVQINSLEYKGRNLSVLSVEYLRDTEGWTYRYSELDRPYDHISINAGDKVGRYGYNPLKIREIGLISYFGRLQSDPENFLPLNRMPFHKIPWSSVALHVCHTTIRNSYILYVYNASVVALCISDPDKMITPEDPTLPKFFKEMPVCRCLGYGIVRGISMEEKCFYVLTALAKDDLAKVNTLLRGSLEIPVQLLLLQNVDTHVPYLATRRWETGMELGLKVIKGRTFRVARRKRL